mmetsp:Transcript_17377/g.27114  ORF Transcript_17377/g.27114 Transcript_17377/m.27114 type:complete len:315 (-) Transcript_17377:1945-2889(-)
MAKCFFRHPPDMAGVEPITQRPRKPGKRPSLRNTGRAGVLRRFLIDAYGLEYLKTGNVLDIAGGVGELAFEFINVNGVSSVVVDPRDLRLAKFVKKYHHGMYHRNIAAKGVRPRSEGMLPVRHIGLLADSEFFQMLGFEDENGVRVQDFNGFKSNCVTQASLTRLVEKGQALRWTPNGLLDHDNEQGRQYEERNEDNDIPWRHLCVEIEDASTIIEILENVSLVCGMHTDQATGALVDLAIALNKPFAVVPCCVYQKSFPKRKLGDGKCVETYEDLIQYIIEKDPENVKVETLDFEGKNKVVYRLAPENREIKD